MLPTLVQLPLISGTSSITPSLASCLARHHAALRKSGRGAVSEPPLYEEQVWAPLPVQTGASIATYQNKRRMDPASAAIAFVGFSASLTTLVGLVVNCSTTLYDLQRKLKEAPKDILHLQYELRNLQALLVEIQSRFRKDGRISTQQGFQGLWESVSAQMEQDIESFMATVSKHSSQFRTPVRKRVSMRIRYIFDEKTVEEFRRRISRHIDSLSMVQAFMMELVS